MAATFNVPNGRDPRKLMNNPVMKIFSSGCMKKLIGESADEFIGREFNIYPINK